MLGGPQPKQHSHTQPQFTKEEISSAIALLEKKYPKLFSMENPKPLKVGVFNEVASKRILELPEVETMLG